MTQYLFSLTIFCNNLNDFISAASIAFSISFSTVSLIPGRQKWPQCDKTQAGQYREAKTLHWSQTLTRPTFYSSRKGGINPQMENLSENEEVFLLLKSDQLWKATGLFLSEGWGASVFCATLLRIKTTHLKEAEQVHPKQVLSFESCASYLWPLLLSFLLPSWAWDRLSSHPWLLI